nr:unnamed protein product [Digitaria exilis]
MASSGDGERSLLQSLDYPCTKRLRLRRLLAYHRRYMYEDVYKLMGTRMRLVFDVKDLVLLVKRGQWRAASSYVGCFFDVGSTSEEATLLLLFLQDLLALNEFAQGVHIVTCLLSDWILSIYKEPVLAEYPCFATLVADVLFLRSEHAGDFLNWHLVRNKAAEMVYKTPELKDRLHFPCGPQNLYHVLPIRSRYFRVQASSSIARHVKIGCHKESTDYAQSYLRMKRRLASSNRVASPDYSAYSAEFSARIKGELRMALLEKALKAGAQSVVEQGRTPDYSSIDDTSE